MPSKQTRLRIIFALVLLAAITTAGLVVWQHPALRSIVSHPQAHAQIIRQWAAQHRAATPMLFAALFFSLGSLALPVWWLQVVAGLCFGLLWGTVIGLGASVITSVLGASVARFLFGHALRERVETHARKLRDLDERLGHNGLLVVTGVRLAHVIPAGLSNYAFGLTRISLRNIALGTLIGGLPSTLSLVAVGANRHLLHDWRFLTALVILNLTSVSVLLVRYLRPEWFKGMGLE